MRYVVYYELRDADRDTSAFRAELGALSATKLLDAQWILRFSGRAPELRDRLRAHLGHDDSLFVACLDNNDWAGVNLHVKINTV